MLLHLCPIVFCSYYSNYYYSYYYHDNYSEISFRTLADNVFECSNNNYSRINASNFMMCYLVSRNIFLCCGQDRAGMCACCSPPVMFVLWWRPCWQCACCSHPVVVRWYPLYDEGSSVLDQRTYIDVSIVESILVGTSPWCDNLPSYQRIDSQLYLSSLLPLHTHLRLYDTLLCLPSVYFAIYDIGNLKGNSTLNRIGYCFFFFKLFLSWYLILSRTVLLVRYISLDYYWRFIIIEVVAKKDWRKHWYCIDKYF